jgi:hypothetical protein
VIRLLLLVALVASCRASPQKNPGEQTTLDQWATSTFGGSVAVVLNSAESHAIIKKLMTGAGYKKQALPFWVVRVSDKMQIAGGQYLQGQIGWKSDFEVAYLAAISLEKAVTEPELTILDIRKSN